MKNHFFEIKYDQKKVVNRFVKIFGIFHVSTLRPVGWVTLKVLGDERCWLVRLVRFYETFSLK
jgi:hypothetical protein